jgi:UDP-N-acetylglucosamine transferase subunit ALG13
VIFIIFGTIPVPFPRLAQKIDEIAGRSCRKFVIQSGYTRFPFIHAEAQHFMKSSEMQKNIGEASLIITHGGYGAIFECLRQEKKVIAVPRRSGEHNHDQRELVQELEKGGHILAVCDIDDLEDRIAQAVDFVPLRLPRGCGAEEINKFIREVVSRQ